MCCQKVSIGVARGAPQTYFRSLLHINRAYIFTYYIPYASLYILLINSHAQQRELETLTFWRLHKPRSDEKHPFPSLHIFLKTLCLLTSVNSLDNCYRLLAHIF